MLSLSLHVSLHFSCSLFAENRFSIFFHLWNLLIISIVGWKHSNDQHISCSILKLNLAFHFQYFDMSASAIVYTSLLYGNTVFLARWIVYFWFYLIKRFQYILFQFFIKNTIRRRFLKSDKFTKTSTLLYSLDEKRFFYVFVCYQ